MNLSLHFTLAEATRSIVGDRWGIVNDPPPALLENMRLAAEQLERVRVLLGEPIEVSSWYRCPELNEKVNGAKDSAHLTGWAIDFESPLFGPPLLICRKILASPLGFDQLIYEGSWTHLSFAPALRREVLTARFTPLGALYSQGLPQ